MRNSHILTPGCSRLHSISEMRKVDAISIHVGFFLPEACSHWYFLQVRSNATNRKAGHDEPKFRKKPTHINNSTVFRLSIILWSRLHLKGQSVRDSHILVGFSPATYPQGEVEKPTRAFSIRTSLFTYKCPYLFVKQWRWMRKRFHLSWPRAYLYQR